MIIIMHILFKNLMVAAFATLLLADYDFAKQWNNIGGSSGSKIESWNNLNWVNFEQMLMFTK